MSFKLHLSMFVKKIDMQIVCACVRADYLKQRIQTIIHKMAWIKRNFSQKNRLNSNGSQRRLGIEVVAMGAHRMCNKCAFFAECLTNKAHITMSIIIENRGSIQRLSLEIHSCNVRNAFRYFFTPARHSSSFHGIKTVVWLLSCVLRFIYDAYGGC